MNNNANYDKTVLQEEFLKTVSDLLRLLDQAEDLAAKVRKELNAIVQAEEWTLLQASKPLDPEDRALLWLKRKLSEIMQKHPRVKADFVYKEGNVVGLRYIAPDRESREDVESVAGWAFKVAAERTRK